MEEKKEKQEQRSHPAVGNNICRFCSKTFSSKASLSRHITEQHESNPEKPNHVCHECGAGFSRLGSLQIHTRDKHRDKRLLNGPKSTRRTKIRRFCVSGFPMQGGRTPHIRAQRESNGRNSEARNHSCRFCGAGYTAICYLTRHIRTIHDSNYGRDKCKMLYNISMEFRTTGNPSNIYLKVKKLRVMT